MSAKISYLTIFRSKGESGESVTEVNLLKDLGVEGDFHQGGERQVTILPAETRRWLDAQTERGLCFDRFRENILIEGSGEIKPGSLLSVGDAVLRISAFVKPCFDECALAACGTPCRLSGRAVFATVERGGTVRVGDAVVIS